MADRYKDLEDYGLIGNLETCALVGQDGAIDWCCLPHLQSPSVFASILDADRGGAFAIRPQAKFSSHQTYSGQTNILETNFQTPAGVVTLTDFMPVRTDHDNAPRAIMRKVACDDGMVQMALRFRPRFDYARVVPTLEPASNGIIAHAQDLRLFLQTPVDVDVHSAGAEAQWSMSGGDVVWFVLHVDDDATFAPDRCAKLLEETKRYWSDWTHTCDGEECEVAGPWHEIAVRSALVLKLMTDPVIGTIVAAPTTSLPEAIGGVRNWDYRYVWLRDASFTVQALHTMGHLEEARDYFRWFRDICDKDNPEHIRIMYTLKGENVPEEQILDHLEGYRCSSPVRIGNDATNQRQLDIYGELVNAFFEVYWNQGDVSETEWDYFENITDHVCDVWQEPDAGVWEVRGPHRHYTYSKLMCWVALDRGIKIVKRNQFEAPLDTWERTHEEIRRAILERGFDEERNSFVQSFDSTELDATSLLVPLLGFLPADDPRVLGTIDATLDELTENGFVRRYVSDDGLPGEEGAFTLCTCWLVCALALAGRVDDAQDIFLGLLQHVSPLGLLAEEIDPATGKLLGNYPQAYSHIGLINTARYLGRALRDRNLAE